MTTWLEAHPSADAQRLRSLVRAARKDTATQASQPELGEQNGQAQRNGRAYRELFQMLKTFVRDDT
jgi:ribosome-associated protein